MDTLRPPELGPVEASQFLLVAVVVFALVLSSPLFGISLTESGPPATVGNGNATVTSVDIDAESIRITPGRFGTDVSYVRIPDARVDVTRVDGAPRLVYRVEIPALNIDHDATKVLFGPETTTVRLDDVAVRPAELSADRYDARVTVRVQSYTVDRVVSNESVTIEVER